MSIRVGLHILILFSLITCFTQASAAPDGLFITVDSIDYAVELEKSSFVERIKINNDVNNDTSDLELYQGTAPEISGSWVAASYNNGEWQGLASVYDKLYELKGVGLSGSALSIIGSNSSVSMEATEMDMSGGDFDVANMCAMPHAEIEKPQSALASVVPSAGTTNLNSVALAVGEVTQAVNVVLALDQFHTNQFDADSVPRALRILNNVDAIYRASLGIALNNTAIVSYSDANPIFANETDANTLLDQLRITQAGVFGPNQRTLGSMLTYRDIQVGGMLGVAGIAYLNGTCSKFAVSVNEDRVSEVVSTIILAHEMGHNFGANHDGAPANPLCPVSQNIMSPIVANGLTSFSNCSRTEINTHIAGGTCYKQPIDIALSRFGATPPNNLSVQQEITRQVAVNNNGTLSISNVQIDGVIDNVVLAKFSGVTVNGQACTLLAAGKSYLCNIASIAAYSQQIITENIQVVSLGTFTFSSSFDNSNVAQRIDILAGNQFVTDSRIANQVAATPNAPSGLSASAQTTGDIALTWSDNSNNEQGFQILRSNNGGGLTAIANLAANSASYTDSYTNLQVGTAYTYQVVAMNTIGNALSNQSTATALERTIISSSPAPSSGGGGAFYLLTTFLLFARVAKSFK